MDADYTVVHTYKQRHLSPERVSVRSAGSACGQRCIVAGPQLPWTFDSASIQLLLVSQNQQASGQPVWPTTPASNTLLCSRSLGSKAQAQIHQHNVPIKELLSFSFFSPPLFLHPSLGVFALVGGHARGHSYAQPHGARGAVSHSSMSESISLLSAKERAPPPRPNSLNQHQPKIREHTDSFCPQTQHKLPTVNNVLRAWPMWACVFFNIFSILVALQKEISSNYKHSCHTPQIRI